jgi:transcriptional regulator with XRE-family HTH domain
MTSPGQIDLGNALRILRVRAGLTQEDLAACVNLDGPYISRIEAGARDIRWSTLNSLLAALGSDLSSLQDVIKHGEGSRAPWRQSE